MILTNASNHIAEAITHRMCKVLPISQIWVTLARFLIRFQIFNPLEREAFPMKTKYCRVFKAK